MSKRFEELETAGKYKISFLVDSEDLDKISPYKWFFGPSLGGMIRTRIKRKDVLLHRMIMQCPENLEVDHINHNRLDNRKSNLRIVTRSENILNRRIYKNKKSSKYKGVFLRKDTNKWRSIIQISGKVYRSQHNSEQEAVRHYNAMCTKLHGEFGCPNSIYE